MTWTVNADTRVVQFTWRDPYTFAEWETAMSKILAHPSYAPGYRFLVDRREAATPEASFINGMANFFAFHGAALQGVRAALIVRDDAGFGMGRMTELTATGRNPAMTVRVFRDPSEAERWLTSGTGEPTA